MKVNVVNHKNSVDFVFKQVNPEFVNTLRRTAISEVPCLAVEIVKFINNSSALYDEIIAHRLGMLSIQADPLLYEFKNKCKCKGKGCARCQCTFSLKAKGPKTVYAEEMICSDKNVKVRYPKTSITLLNEGQELEFEAVAQLGISKQHAKWNTCHATLRYEPETKMEKGKEINLTKNPETIILTIESYGQMSEKDIIKHSISILKNKLKEFNSLLK